MSNEYLEERKINEMARLMYEAKRNRCFKRSCNECQFGDIEDDLCMEKVIAKYLIDHGYRKASDVVEEIVEYIEKQLRAIDMFKDDEDDFYNGEQHALDVLKNYLKKKYESEGAE